MSGTFNKPVRKSASITEWLDLARLVLDAALTETTQAHRDDGFQGAEAASPTEFNYILQRLHDWLIRSGVTLVGEHRTATITVGGAVTTGDTRRLTLSSPAAFTVDYATQASDASNNDIASNWAAAINDDSDAQKYLTASASGADVTIEWLTGLEAVSWSASVTVSVGAPTAVLTEVVDGDLYVRLPDDDTLSGLLMGSTSTEDIGATGDKRMFFDQSKGAFRAGEVNSTQWDDASRGAGSAAFGLNCTADGAYSFAAGQGSQSAGDHSVAIGDGASCSGDDSVALGESASAGTSNVAIGPNTTAIGTGSIVLGNAAGTDVNGVDALAAGGSAAATAARAVAIGNASAASGDDSVSIGISSSATADDALAVGYDANATALGATALGANADATAAGALAVGATQLAVASGPLASAAGAIAIGAGATGTSADETLASAMSGVAVGRGCEAAAAGFAVGDYAIAREEGVFALSAQPIKTTPTPVTGDRGSAQAGTVTKVSQTTDGSTVVLGGATSTIQIPSGRAVHMVGEVIAMNGTDSLTTRWAVEILARNVGGTVTSAILTTAASGGDAPGGTTAVATPVVVAGTGVKIDVTGTAAKDINWIGHFRFAEIAIP